MSLYLRDPDVELHLGDALEVLRGLPDESVHCVATSPPFFGLRNYQTGRWEGGDLEHEHDRVGARDGRGGSGALDKRSADAMPSTLPAETCSCGAVYIDQQIGLEASPDEWAARLVEVFREARRVLRRDGSLWVECGDSYCGQANGRSRFGEGGGEKTIRRPSYQDQNKSGTVERPLPAGTKPKDLLGQPFLLAFALRADGWYWRGCNIWAKPNAMPESAKDRCTVAHSYVLHFSKSARYFFDGDAISEPAAWERWGDQTVPKHEGTETAAGWIKPKGKNELLADISGKGVHRTRSGFNERWDDKVAENGYPAAKHPRSVWTIPTQGFPEAHFATWPEALARRIILAACPEWVCEVCGKARERIVEKSKYEPEVVEPGVRFVDESRGDKTRKLSGADYNRQVQILGVSWSDCGHNAYRPGVVLDPFAGSGTTAYVARKLGRRSIGIDLNPDYLAMAARRLQQQSLFALDSGDAA